MVYIMSANLQPTAYGPRPTAYGPQPALGGCQMDPACLGSGETPITWGGRILLVCLHHAGFIPARSRPEAARLDPLARRTVLRMQPLVHHPAAPPREPLAPQPPEPPRFCSRCAKRLLHRGNLSGVCTPCQRRFPVASSQRWATPRYAVCAVCARTYRRWSRSHDDMCRPCGGRFNQHNSWRRKHGFAPLPRAEWMALKREHANLRLRARTIG